MSTVKELHHEAMNCAEIGFWAKKGGDLDRAREFFYKALTYEKQAAQCLDVTEESEPTRSILYRSAASLAQEYGDYREAEKLIAHGLSGFPPEEIAIELRELLDQVNFYRHMDLRSVKLEEKDIQISMAGREIDNEFAESNAVLPRLHSIENLILRTSERLDKKPYRETGISSAAKKFPVYLSLPRAGSFAITLRLGINQLSFPGLDQATPIIEEILQCVRLVNSMDERSLSARISDDAYFNNFIGLIQKIAPDGESVTGIGFTGVINGTEIKVPLQRKQSSISVISKRSKDHPNNDESIEVVGQLRAAKAISENEIRLVDDNNNKHVIVVPEGMMSDIVKPLWFEKVRVTCVRRNKKLFMNDIEKAE